MTVDELRDQMLVERYADAHAATRDATPWTPAEQAAHRQVLAAAGLIPRWNCLPCLRGEHGPDCQGRPCLCRCRAVLEGPFGRHGDPTMASATERVGREVA